MQPEPELTAPRHESACVSVCVRACVREGESEGGGSEGENKSH